MTGTAPPALVAGKMYVDLHVTGRGLPDAVVFVADAPSPEVSRLASNLALRLAVPFESAFSTAAAASALASLRAHGAQNVAIAAYLPSGPAYAALLDLGADHVTTPLGASPSAVRLAS